jgi:hypothetical protein
VSCLLCIGLYCLHLSHFSSRLLSYLSAELWACMSFLSFGDVHMAIKLSMSQNTQHTFITIPTFIDSRCISGSLDVFGCTAYQ